MTAYSAIWMTLAIQFSTIIFAGLVKLLFVGSPNDRPGR